MEYEKSVGIEEMIAVLSREVGSRFPVKITKDKGEVVVRYLRGFADQQKNILLISENAGSLALKILEVKDIRTLEFGVENTGGQWAILHAAWHSKRT